MPTNKHRAVLRRTCIQLFLTMFRLSAFTFGGGFVIVTLLKREFCDKRGWISQEEMLDLAAIAQTAPGAVAVNTAILAGRRVAGFPGVCAAFLGIILPPMLILSIVSLFYSAFAENRIAALALQGMQAGAAAVIAETAYSLGAGVVRARVLLSDLVMASAFAAVFFFRISAVYVLAAAAVIGGLRAAALRLKAART